MENNSAQESLYDQLDRLEQSLDSELLELQGYLQNPLVQTEEKNLFTSCSNETCIVKSTTKKECHGETLYREVLYRCGSEQCYTYKGDVKLNLEQVFNLRLDDIPAIQAMIRATLKLQQNNFEQASHDDESTCLDEFDSARAFLISELTRLEADIDRLDAQTQIFELVGDTFTSGIFQDTLFGYSRFYSNEHMFITIYFEGVLYATRVSLDEVSQLDVDYSTCCIPHQDHCKGSTLAIYSGSTRWMKLSAYDRSQERNSKVTTNCGALQNKECLESDRYVQSYYILKHDKQSHGQKVLFRFGSWMYRGRIDLPPLNSLQDIPIVIRVMRLSQDRLNFVGDVSSVQACSEFDFDKPMRYSASVTKFIESEAVSCEMQLRQILIEEPWVENDDKTSFFIFECAETQPLESVQLVCNKIYSANGIITISIYYDKKWYLLFEESNGEESPLLDSKFPDFSTELDAKGYALKTYPRGHEEWSELRQLSLWQLAESPYEQKEKEIFVSSSDEQMPSENETKQRKHNYLRSIIPLRRKSKRINS